MQSLNNLAGLLFRKGEYGEAGPIYRSIYEFNKENLGERHRYTASTLGSLASVQREYGNLNEAETLQQQALEIYIELFGEEHLSVANAQSNMGAINRLQGNLPQAIQSYEAALDFWRSQETPPIEMAFPLVGLGLTLLEIDAERAETLLREALAMREKHLKDDDLVLAETRGALGRCLALQGNRDRARPLLESALQSFLNAGKMHDRRAVEIAGWLEEVG